MSLLSGPSARQLYCIEGLLAPGHPVSVVVLRDIIKGITLRPYINIPFCMMKVEILITTWVIRKSP
jgi:hypothetical protein